MNIYFEYNKLCAIVFYDHEMYVFIRRHYNYKTFFKTSTYVYTSTLCRLNIKFFYKILNKKYFSHCQYAQLDLIYITFIYNNIILCYYCICLHFDTSTRYNESFVLPGNPPSLSLILGLVFGLSSPFILFGVICGGIILYLVLLDKWVKRYVTFSK